ncbi:MAG: hypothetical protein OEZ40_01640 [Candidatus Bathyarchaeota archaeon]|nr:hypothetical protein [Candidatus Bathyarchaeota archaeon]
MTTPEGILKKISDTLEKPVKKPTKPDYVAFRAKVDALKQLDPSLFTLFRMCDEILVYIDKQQRDQTLLDSFASDVKSLTARLDLNLKKIDGVQAELREQIQKQVSSRLDVFEAKQRLMIKRVDGVLQELERVLRQM